GKAGLQMLTAGSMDLTMVAGMPMIDAILNGQPLWLLAAVSHSDRYVGLVVPADVERVAQLQGTRVAVTPGTTSDLFVHTLLSSVGLTPTDVIWIGLQPDEMPYALASGQVDVAGTIEPLLTQTAAAIPRARVLYSVGIFLDYWLLVASPALVHSKPKAVQKI